MKKKIFILSTALLTCSLAYGQNLQEEKVTYYYTQLPLQPLDESIKSYSVEITTPYLENLTEFKKEAYLQFQKDSANYPQAVAKAKSDHEALEASYERDVEIARENYKMEMEEYDKLSTFEKLAMEDHQKPQLKLPSKPVYREPAKPVYRDPDTREVILFDPEELENSYIDLHDFEKAEDADIQMHIKLHDFEYFDPTRLSKEVSEYSVQAQQTQKRTVYYYETKYRHPASIEINKDNKVLYNHQFEPADGYYLYSSEAVPNKFNLEKGSVENSFKDINDFINSEHAYKPIELTTEVGYVKNKKGEYDDLEKAKDLALSAYAASKDNPEVAAKELSEAVKIWNAALSESDIDDKKARIDNKVTPMLYFNLIVANMYLNNYDECKSNIDKLENLSLSFSERKRLDDLKLQYEDRKKRYEVNS